jgi:hypothetical protein
LSVDTGLSVLLPVYNAQHALEPTVREILDVLPDRDTPFELSLVDDGSVDDTTDQAYELAARYPQVGVIHHPARLGLAEAIAAALASKGIATRVSETTPIRGPAPILSPGSKKADFIVVAAEVYALEPDDLRTLWQLRELERRQSRTMDARSSGRETLLGKWPRLRAGHIRGSQLIRRSTFELFRASLEQSRRIDAGNSSAIPAPGRPNFLRSPNRAARELGR